MKTDSQIQKEQTAVARRKENRKLGELVEGDYSGKAPS